MLRKQEKRDPLKQLYQTYRPALWGGLSFAVVLYGLMMAQQLTNTFDGLWNQTYYHAGLPELTSGRWLLHYIDKLTLGLHADPITSLAALALFLVGGVSLGLSLACYQAYLGVFCVVALFVLLFLGRTAEGHLELGQIGRRALCVLAALLLGGLFYRASLSFFLARNAVTLSSYNGADSITLSGVLAALPENLAKTYHYFRVYFFTDTFQLNRLQAHGRGCFLLLLLLFAAGMLRLGIRCRKQPALVCLLVLAAAALPVAGSAYLLLAGDKLELQMSAGLALLVPLSLVFVLSCLPRRRLPWVLGILFGLALLYGNAMQGHAGLV